MLKSIQIENFKAFAANTKIELAPITLIYGQNSAGKSSILQALNLLKQSHESRESGASLLPRAEKGIVDLGSFRELLFDHDIHRKLGIGVEMDAGDARRWGVALERKAMTEPDHVPVGITLGFGLGENSPDFDLRQLSVAVGSSENCLASFTTRPLSKAERDAFRWGSSGVRMWPVRSKNILGAECTWVTESPDVWRPVFQAFSTKRVKVLGRLDFFKDEIPMRSRLSLEGEDAPPKEELKRIRKAFEEAFRFYSGDFDLPQLTKRMTEAWKGTVFGLDGFMPIDAMFNAPFRLPEVEIMGLSGPIESVWLPTNNVVRVALLASRLLADSLESLFPMGPFRRPPERFYISTGTSPEDVGYRGDHLPDLLLRRPNLVESANHWLTKLEIGYLLKVRPISSEYSDLFEVRLVDTRRGGDVEVGLSDAGFGICQLLPFLVQSLASHRRIISIEQPEVHIHPRLQADLGELVANCIREPFSHQYLIETHSEHLVLRLQRLIREQRLKPADVAIIFVERGPTGSQAKRLNLDNKGEFIDEWPGGFFPERLRELL
jgi:hypothetical protein